MFHWTLQNFATQLGSSQSLSISLNARFFIQHNVEGHVMLSDAGVDHLYILLRKFVFLDALALYVFEPHGTGKARPLCKNPFL